MADRRSVRCDGALVISFASSREALIQPPALWTRAKPTQRHTILEQLGFMGDWLPQLYTKPEVSQQMPLLETT